MRSFSLDNTATTESNIGQNNDITGAETEGDSVEILDKGSGKEEKGPLPSASSVQETMEVNVNVSTVNVEGSDVFERSNFVSEDRRA